MASVKICDGRTVLYQWDTGVRLEMCGCSRVTECHFVTSEGVIKRDVVDNICDVPDAALKQAGKLIVYAFSRTEDEGTTRHEFRLAVYSRPKPADYIDPPDEYDNLEALAERIAPLIPDGGGGGIAKETDPTVPGWAKAEQKPTYTAEEVGALPVDAEIVDQTARDGVATLSKEIGDLSEAFDATQYETKTVVMTEKNIISGHFVQSDGKLTSVVVDNYVCTDYIDIPFIISKPITVRCAIVGNCSLAWYDRDKTFISSISGKTAADYGLTAQTALQDVTLTLPENAMYLRFGATTQQNAYTDPSQLFISGTVRAGDDEYVDSVKSAISDSNVLVIGDSISTDYYGEYEKWVTALCNVGFFSAGKVDNESIHATGFVARYNDNVTTFLQRINAIENPGKYDLVIVFGGINDFIQNIPFGEAGGDETAYFIPAVDAFFESLTTKFVGARIAVLLPLRTRFNNANNEGKSETEYGDYIKTVAEEYSLPVLDLTRQSGFYPYKTAFRDKWTLTEYSGGDGVTGDGVHPNEEYERRFLAPMIRHFLQGLM